jgi:hypothetical protein
MYQYFPPLFQCGEVIYSIFLVLNGSTLYLLMEYIVNILAMPSNGLTTVMTQTILDTGKNNHGNAFQWFDTCHDANNLRHR